MDNSFVITEVIVFYMVTCTGFEPINACVKGMCVNRFTNRPYLIAF